MVPVEEFTLKLRIILVELWPPVVTRCFWVVKSLCFDCRSMFRVPFGFVFVGVLAALNVFSNRVETCSEFSLNKLNTLCPFLIGSKGPLSDL